MNSRLNPDSDVRASLDLRDKKIVSALAENARLPIAQLARKYRINRDTVTYKMKRMEEFGFINQYFAQCNFHLIGYNTFHIYFLIDENDRKKELMERLINHPNTKSVIEYHDTWDIEWTLLARGFREFDAIMTQLYSEFADVIIEKQHLIVIDNYHTTNLPYPFYKDFASKQKRTPAQSAKIDAKDFIILKELARDGRANAIDIAKKANLSTDAVISRIKKLSASSLIQRFTVLTDRSRIDYRWYTLALELKFLNKEYKAKLKTFIEDHPHVIRCVRTFGSWDLIFTITTEKSRDFHMTVKNIKKHFSPLIKNHQTWIAYKEHIFNSFPKAIDEKDVVGRI